MDIERELERRIVEFEENHQADVLRGGPGWVPRIRGRDYLLGVAVNLLITIWLIIALTGG
jgi:hypothetical protein